jgi:broad specificity phosphatase PhoE
MAKIILIRHAQASLGKSNYDALSPLGFKQAEVLGKYIEQSDWQPGIIISGELNRHRQTTASLISGLSDPMPVAYNPDWNEFDFTLLLKTYLQRYPEQQPQNGDIQAFFSLLKKAMLAWSSNELTSPDNNLESWEEFGNRIWRAIHAAEQQSSDKPTLIVSSGGAIAMLLKQILGVDAKTMINLNFQIRNTSFTEVHIKPFKQSLAAFNQVNHLSDRHHKEMLTYA